MKDHPEFILKLRAPADPSDVDGVRRLRSALKRLWRGYSLRALEVRPVEEDIQSTVNPAPESENTPQNTAVSATGPEPDKADVAKTVAIRPQNATRMSGRKAV